MYKNTKLQDDFTDRRITSEDFYPMKERTEKTLTGLQLKLKNLKQSTSPFKTFINKEFRCWRTFQCITKKLVESRKRRF